MKLASFEVLDCSEKEGRREARLVCHRVSGFAELREAVNHSTTSDDLSLLEPAAAAADDDDDDDNDDGDDLVLGE